MANPFREGGSLNIPTQAAADEMKKSGSQDYNDFLFYQKYGLSRSGSDKMGEQSKAPLGDLRAIRLAAREGQLLII
jgi:hypothetical protein